jgi:hypothetical protein
MSDRSIAVFALWGMSLESRDYTGCPKFARLQAAHAAMLDPVQQLAEIGSRRVYTGFWRHIER